MKNMEENKYKNPIMEHYEVDGQMNLSECMQAMQMQRKLTILKGALILREILGVRVNSKEETTRMAQKYTDAELSFWISFLREESHKAADIREKEAEERIQWEVDHDSPQNTELPATSVRSIKSCRDHQHFLLRQRFLKMEWDCVITEKLPKKMPWNMRHGM